MLIERSPHMIYIDKAGHLVSDISEDDLHQFAFRIGLKREWYKRKRLPHYNCTTDNIKNKAIIMGARFVSSKEIVDILRKRFPKNEGLDENGVRVYVGR